MRRKETIFMVFMVILVGCVPYRGHSYTRVQSKDLYYDCSAKVFKWNRAVNKSIGFHFYKGDTLIKQYYPDSIPSKQYQIADTIISKVDSLKVQVVFDYHFIYDIVILNAPCKAGDTLWATERKQEM